MFINVLYKSLKVDPSQNRVKVFVFPEWKRMNDEKNLQLFFFFRFAFKSFVIINLLLIWRYLQ